MPSRPIAPCRVHRCPGKAEHEGRCQKHWDEYLAQRARRRAAQLKHEMIGCVDPSCDRPASEPSLRCLPHHLEYRRMIDRRRVRTRSQRGSQEWDDFASRYLKEHGRCECEDCIRMPYGLRPIATEIDHIDGCGRGGARAFDPTNLRAMAHACHSRWTARMQGGWSRAKGEQPVKLPQSRGEVGLGGGSPGFMHDE